MIIVYSWHNCSISLCCHILSITCGYLGRLQEHRVQHHQPASSTRQQCWRPWSAGTRIGRIGHQAWRQRVGHHACMKHVVDSVNRFCSEDTHVLCADRQVIYMRYRPYTMYKLVFRTPHILSKGWTAWVVCWLYLIYPRYKPDISMTYDISESHIVCDRNGCSLQTFGCLEWESELYRGIMRARSSANRPLIIPN